jgi:bacitracin transport system permease protein
VLELLNLVLTEATKLKRTFILWVGILVSAVIPMFVMMMNAEREISVLDFGKSSLSLSVFLAFPALYTLVATFIFGREYYDGTMKTLLSVPISRYKLVSAKLIFITLYFLCTLCIHAVLSTTLAILTGSVGAGLDVFVQVLLLNIRVLIPYTLVMLPIIGFIVISRKSYFLPIGVSVAITICNVLIISSKYVAFYPWTAVFRFCGNIQGMINIDFVYPVFYSVISLGCCTVLGIAMIVLGLSKQEY